MCQLAQAFYRNDGKLLRCVRRPYGRRRAGHYDGSIQRKDVGLKGDAIDDADDVGDLRDNSLIGLIIVATSDTTEPPFTSTWEAEIAK